MSQIPGFVRRPLVSTSILVTLMLERICQWLVCCAGEAALALILDHSGSGSSRLAIRLRPRRSRFGKEDLQ